MFDVLKSKGNSDKYQCSLLPSSPLGTWALLAKGRQHICIACALPTPLQCSAVKT